MYFYAPGWFALLATDPHRCSRSCTTAAQRRPPFSSLNHPIIHPIIQSQSSNHPSVHVASSLVVPPPPRSSRIVHSWSARTMRVRGPLESFASARPDRARRTLDGDRPSSRRRRRFFLRRDGAPAPPLRLGSPPGAADAAASTPRPDARGASSTSKDDQTTRVAASLPKKMAAIRGTAGARTIARSRRRGAAARRTARPPRRTRASAGAAAPGAPTTPRLVTNHAALEHGVSRRRSGSGRASSVAGRAARANAPDGRRGPRGPRVAGRQRPARIFRRRTSLPRRAGWAPRSAAPARGGIQSSVEECCPGCCPRSPARRSGRSSAGTRSREGFIEPRARFPRPRMRLPSALFGVGSVRERETGVVAACCLESPNPQLADRSSSKTEQLLESRRAPPSSSGTARRASTAHAPAPIEKQPS